MAVIANITFILKRNYIYIFTFLNMGSELFSKGLVLAIEAKPDPYEHTVISTTLLNVSIYSCLTLLYVHVTLFVPLLTL